MLHAAAKQIRDNFDEHRNVDAGEELDKLMTKAWEAIKFMKYNTVSYRLIEEIILTMSSRVLLHHGLQLSVDVVML
jgi:hypothetical protein